MFHFRPHFGQQPVDPLLPTRQLTAFRPLERGYYPRPAGFVGSPQRPVVAVVAPITQRPLFIAMTIGFLGYGYWLVYQKPKTACAEGEACARPLPKTLVKAGLWFATILVILAFAWPAIVPLILK